VPAAPRAHAITTLHPLFVSVFPLSKNMFFLLTIQIIIKVKSIPSTNKSINNDDFNAIIMKLMNLNRSKLMREKNVLAEGVN